MVFSGKNKIKELQVHQQDYQDRKALLGNYQ